MMVKTETLKAGCKLTKDVYSKSVKPLMKAGTVLNATHIAFLKAFLIDQVEVDRLMPGIVKNPVEKKVVRETAKPSKKSSEPEPSFSPLDQKYWQSVKAYQVFFANWQSGASVSIGDFRSAMMPLIMDLIEDPMWLASFLVRHGRAENLADRSVTFGLLSAFFAKRSNYSTGDTVQFGLAGMLADCGLSKLPPSLLNKKDAYVGSERALYERHAVDSYKMLKGLQTLKNETVIAVVQHHEREDGSGFPLNIKGDQLSLNGKMLMICDSVLDHMSKSRSGNVLSALDTLREFSYGKLSRYLLDKFCYELMTLFIGMTIQLSDGQTGEITFIPTKEPTRPMIHLANNEVISLAENRNVTIERFM
jgi:HD-GYP domain-containing protein (c-di-GMP phosphodiesterase class II)